MIYVKVAEKKLQIRKLRPSEIRSNLEKCNVQKKLLATKWRYAKVGFAVS